jgi:hypothetical protein
MSVITVILQHADFLPSNNRLAINRHEFDPKMKTLFTVWEQQWILQSHQRRMQGGNTTQRAIDGLDNNIKPTPINR